MKRREIEHYEILRKLGSGGSGIVYLANDTLLMRPVVLKILKRGSLSLEQMRTTVLREARLASAIEHPNVCAIYEIGESSDEAYIVMQYVPGRSLDRLIAQGPASVQLVLSVGAQIADGLLDAAGHRLARIGIRKSRGELLHRRLRRGSQRRTVRQQRHFQFVREHRKMILIPQDAIEAVARGAHHLDRDLLLAGRMPEIGRHLQPYAVIQRDGRGELRVRPKREQ